MFELTIAKLYGLLAFVAKRHITNLGPLAWLVFSELTAMHGRVGDTDYYMRCTDNWRVWLVDVLGRGDTRPSTEAPFFGKILGSLLK